MQCYELLLPLIGYAQRAVKVLVWEPPLLTWLCYMAFTFVCFNPRFFIPIMHLPLIGVLVKKGWYRYLITQYTKYGTVGLYGRKYMGPLPSAKEVGLMDEFTYELDSGGEESDEERAIPAAGPPTDNEPLDPAVYGANGVKPSTVEDDLASLGALGTAIGALVAVVPGVQQYLDKAQNGIVSANDGIESLYAVFDWSNTTVSRDALIGLILSAFVFCFIELHLIVFAAGTAILFCTSDVGQKIIKFVSGVAKYLTTRRYKKMESSGSVHADADIQNNIYRAMRRRTKRLTVNRETTKSANVYLATNTRTPTQNAIVSPKSAVVKPPKAASVM
ncbi:hypothetical protein SARC_03027 [Sphaeroforma arctica JP610]|uniref:TECPR1-like DysF domain-containing protein n=1 Tax=Sphaeroforma arctica JP610 TaxID=667725 RepID=A0A0L0G794_9EUKA|nr:hypothetical protein SARC_03027 [Sphaeroforma arctica JP610]KNC84756.1 hypothetical protein SARC_03027 [Sphaeroforma arctica JP610]|eukprot:XP_014158658.1 hypothetical protein SARC_03027 [Sphaeroforma arctica JP610]